MSKMFLIGVAVILLSGCATRMGANYAQQEPLPIDLSSTKYLYGLTQVDDFIQVAAISPSVLAQQARPQIREYVAQDNTEYDEDYEEDYDDEYDDEE